MSLWLNLRSLGSRLPPGLRSQLRRLGQRVSSPFLRRNLKALAVLHGTDKWGIHSYADGYERHLAAIRRRDFVLLEIGIGGYADPRAGGNSLRMWRDYFPRARIHGCDLHPKPGVAGSRIETHLIDQGQPGDFGPLVEQIGRPLVVIDDGSHINRHVIESFEVLWPLLLPGGFYIVEDTQTSYLEEFGGSDDLDDRATMVAYFSRFAQAPNQRLAELPETAVDSRLADVGSVHFYEKLIVLHKHDGA